MIVLRTILSSFFCQNREDTGVLGGAPRLAEFARRGNSRMMPRPARIQIETTGRNRNLTGKRMISTVRSGIKISMANRTEPMTHRQRGLALQAEIIGHKVPLFGNVNSLRAAA